MKLHFRNNGAESYSQGITPLLIPGSASGSAVVNGGVDSFPSMQPVMSVSDIQSNHPQGSALLGGPATQTRREGLGRGICSRWRATFYIFTALLVIALPFAVPVAFSHAIRAVDRFNTTIRRGFQHSPFGGNIAERGIRPPVSVEMPIGHQDIGEIGDTGDTAQSSIEAHGSTGSASLGEVQAEPSSDLNNQGNNGEITTPHPTKEGPATGTGEASNPTNADTLSTSQPLPSKGGVEGAQGSMDDFPEYSRNTSGELSRDASMTSSDQAPEVPPAAQGTSQEIYPEKTMTAHDTASSEGLDVSQADSSGESTLSTPRVDSGAAAVDESSLQHLAGDPESAVSSSELSSSQPLQVASSDFVNPDRRGPLKDPWMPHIELHDGKLQIARTFERRLNADIAPILASHADELWPNASQPCADAVLTFDLDDSPNLEAELRIVTSCGVGKSCTIRPRITDFRKAEISLGEPGEEVHYVRVLDENKVEQHRWGPLKGTLRIGLTDSALIPIRTICANPVASSNRVLSVGELRSAVEAYAQPKQVDVDRRESHSTHEAFSYNAHPHHHIGFVPGRVGLAKGAGAAPPTIDGH